LTFLSLITCLVQKIVYNKIWSFYCGLL
jgi:hypothetical protein